ncbi:MAG: NUDIX domain-containing protein [Candidatus Doudnabacteria bacterium]|nr:NUDIX domain-containing protein [Candidatus Doudnabacteria bacterium]
MKWKREISAGGVVFKKDGSQTFILLIQPSGQTANKDLVWTFPKGHLDNQKAEEAAVREVKEEGGVNAKIIANLGSYKYTFVWEGENIFKIVTYYLMEYVDGDPADHDHEVAEAKWFEIAEAEKNLTYKIDKEVIEKAKDAI